MTSVNTCLVTGASGFIGRVLCQYLKRQGCRVRALLRRPLDGPWDDSVMGEIGLRKLDDSVVEGVDTVFHLAGIVHATEAKRVNKSLYRTVNVEGSENLARQALGAGVRRFVYFSSVKAAADPGERCVDESWTALPVDQYGLSKYTAETLLLGLGHETEMKVTVLRPALVYGPGLKGNLLRMLAAVDTGRFPPIPETGNQRSMVHVDDLVNAAWLAATHQEAYGKIYIVSDEKAYSTRQLYEWMCGALGRSSAQWSVPVFVLRAGAIAGDLYEIFSGRCMPVNTQILQRLLGSACYRSDKIRRELGWHQHTSIREALPEIVKEYRRAE